MREVIAMLEGLGSFEVEPGNGQNYAGGGAYPDQGGFPTLVSGSYGLAAATGLVAERSNYTPEPGSGQNYSGGGAYPDQGGFPTLVSGSYGLANLQDARVLQGYMEGFAGGSSKVMSVEPGNGQNYTGGGAYPDEGGFPTLVSGSYGLAGLRALAGARAAGLAGLSGAQARGLGRLAASMSVRSNSRQAHAYAAAFMAARRAGKSHGAARAIALSVAGSV